MAVVMLCEITDHSVAVCDGGRKQEGIIVIQLPAAPFPEL